MGAMKMTLNLPFTKFVACMEEQYIEDESRREKTNNMVSDQVRHKSTCTSTEDGLRQDILDLESTAILISVQRKLRS